MKLKDINKKTISNEEELNIKELILKLDFIFEEELSKAFKDIMIISRNKFFNIIIKEVKKFIDQQFGEEIYKNKKFITFFTSSLNNLEDKYKTYINELNKAWNYYQSNKKRMNENSYFFSNFRKHCINTDNVALHKCSDGKVGHFISVIKKPKNNYINNNLGNMSIQYLICNKCLSVYSINKFMNFCKGCNMNYLCSKLSTNENPYLLLATLTKTHCGKLINEKLTCKRCKNNYLYLNMKSNRLQCQNKGCLYNEIPYNIEWTCNICNKNFYSNIKIYNPVEVQEIKDIIKYTLLLKKKAYPTQIPCCKNINLLTQDFFHKSECNGLLYFGEYYSKTIIICEKCKAINFLVKFIWTCPKCGTRFKDNSTIINDDISRKSLNNNMINENLDKNKNNNLNKQNNEKNAYNSNKYNKETLFSLLKRKEAKKLSNYNSKNNSFNNDSKYNYKINNTINTNQKIKNEKNTLYNKNNPQYKKININIKSMIRNENEKKMDKCKSFKNNSFNKKIIIPNKERSSVNFLPIKEEKEKEFYYSPILQNSKPTKNNKKIYRSFNKKFNKEIITNPKIKNSYFNNYFKYINIGSYNNKSVLTENQSEDMYQKIKKEYKDSSKNIDKKDKISRTSFIRSHKNSISKIIKKETKNNLNIKEDIIINDKEEKKIKNIKNNISDNNRNYFNKSKKIRNVKLIKFRNYKRNENNLLPLSINTSNDIFNKSNEYFDTQELNSNNNSNNGENNYKKKSISIYKTENGENIDNNISISNVLKNHKINKKKYYLKLILLRKKDNYKNKKEIEDVYKNDKINAIRIRSIDKHKESYSKKKNELSEISKSEEENKINTTNKNENIMHSISLTTKRKLFRQKLLNGENIIEEKRVKSRKETLKLREKEKNNLKNLLQKEKDEIIHKKIKNIYLNLKDNHIYTQNIIKSRKEANKEKVINFYTENSEIYLDKYKSQ